MPSRSSWWRACARGTQHRPRAEVLDSLDPEDPELENKIEAAKKAFNGFELTNHTLGVIGLGKVGCLVADAAIKLGMHVIGYDPDITVDSAWSLPARVQRGTARSNFLTLHVPLVDATRGMIDAGGIAQMKAGAVVLNFSRGVVDDTAILEALESGQLSKYVCDFPTPHLSQQPGVILLPHLGAQHEKLRRTAPSWLLSRCATTCSMGPSGTR